MRKLLEKIIQWYDDISDPNTYPAIQGWLAIFIIIILVVGWALYMRGI